LHDEVLAKFRVGDLHTEGLESAFYDYVLKGGSPEYPRSTIRQTLAGMDFSRSTLGVEIMGSGYNHMRDFPVSDISIFFFVGRYDYVTLGELSYENYEMLKAPAKSFVWFENSAHNMMYDESELFNRELIRLAHLDNQPNAVTANQSIGSSDDKIALLERGLSKYLILKY
jgi:pimeloyl-ACP methyl ester carboxylesterase